MGPSHLLEAPRIRVPQLFDFGGVRAHQEAGGAPNEAIDRRGRQRGEHTGRVPDQLRHLRQVSSVPALALRWCVVVTVVR